MLPILSQAGEDLAAAGIPAGGARGHREFLVPRLALLASAGYYIGIHPEVEPGGTVVTKVFVIYASKDYPFYERLKAQARAANLPAEFDHIQAKQPWFPAWKAQCRSRIYQCDAAIVLVSRNSTDGDIGWELQCAGDFGMPVLGVNVDKDQKGSVSKPPPGWVVIEWDWAGIARFVKSVGTSATPGR
jgi:hypothetical protein